MNKWTIRMTGLLIVLVIGLIVFDGWFSPQIPPALQQDISLEVNGENRTFTPPAATVPLPRETPPPAFTLESLGGDDGTTAQPVLSNPGSSKNRAREDEQTADSQKTTQKQTVTVSAETATPSPPAAEKAKPRRGGSWVQAGAFSSKENADNLIAQLRKRGWPVDTELAQINGRNVHRVYVGPLSAADANTYIDILGKMGINARPVTR